MVTAPDLAGALPVSGEQQIKARQALLNVDVSNPDNIRMAGDIFGANANKNSNKYTQQGASYKPPSDTSSTADSEPTTAPTPAPAPAPTPEPPSPTDEFVSNLQVSHLGEENQMYSYIDRNGDTIYNDPAVDPNTGRRRRVDSSQSAG
jgi:hypothetical protein